MKTVMAVLVAAGVLTALHAGIELGSQAPDFSLPEVRTGQTVALTGLGEHDATVVLFIATQCPYSNAFNRVMADLGRQYASRKVAFVGINSNYTESAQEVKEHAERHQFPFPVLKDEGNRVADRYGATVTPEAFVFDRSGKLVYHGALGNSRNPTTKESEAVGDELAAALEAVLAGGSPEPAKTKMFGCTIKRK
jgi:peroxiredoxin